MPNVITLPSVVSNEELEVTIKHKKKLYGTPPFVCIGRGENNQNGEALNLCRILLSLSAREGRVLSDLIEAYNYETGCSTVDPWIKNPSAFSEGLASLRRQGLVRRIKRRMHMLNPNLVISPKHYSVLVQRWDALG